MDLYEFIKLFSFIVYTHKIMSTYLSQRKAHTMPKTSTWSSLISWLKPWHTAIKAPVRPTPALQWTMTGPILLHKTPDSNIFSFLIQIGY